MATIDNYKIKIDVEGQQAVDKLRGSVDNLKTAISSIAFGAFISHVIHAADALDELSTATGLSVGYIAKFKEAIALSGGEAEDATKVVTTFFQTLDQAASGTESAQKALQDVGISLNDLKTLSEEDLLNKAIDNLSEMDAGAHRTAVGMAILGKAFRSMDPASIKEALDTGNFDQLQASAAATAAAIDNIHHAYSQLENAAIQAIGPIAKQFADMHIQAEQMEIVFKAISAALAFAIGAKAGEMVLSFIGVLTKLNTILKGTFTISAALQAISGPKGWATMIGGAAAAAAAVYALNQALDETVSKSGTEVSGPLVKPGTENKPGAFPNAQKYTDQEIEARLKAAGIARDQTNILKIQNEEAQKYLRTVIDTMDMETNASNLMRANAQIDQDAKTKIAGLEKDINAELTNRRGPNQEVINQLRQQIIEIENNAAATKKLKQLEYDRNMQLKETALMIKYQQQGMSDNASLANLKYQLDAVGLIGDELKQHQIVQAANIELSNKLLQIDQERAALGKKITDVDEQDFKRRTELAEQYAKDRIQIEQGIADKEKAIRRDGTAGARAAFEQLARSVDPFVIAQNRVTSIFQNMGSAIDRFVDTGKFSFNDFADSIIRDLIKIELKASATRLFTTAFGKGGPFSSMLGFANGGEPPVDRPSIVGEAGPELFIPKVAGTIVPNDKLSALGNNAGANITNTYVTNNISAVDAKSVAQLFAENRKVLLGTVKMAEKEMPYKIR